MDVVTDAEIVSEMVAGDRRALEVLYRRHAPWLGGRLAAMTSSRELAEEALQDTFLAAWRSARSFRGEGPVSAWLWGIARRRLVSLARRVPHRPAVPADPWPATPEELVLGQEEAARVRAAVGNLPDEQREAIESVIFRGRSIAATAKTMGVAEGTVKSRLFRARARIREELGR